MKLDYFLRGTLRKEEVASAFLATAFESSQRFRTYFLELVAAVNAPELAAKWWTVKVEEALEQGRIDVTFEATGVRILVENKIREGAKQVDQLLRYYQAERAREAGDARRILAVYVAPRQLGRDEVERVKESIARELHPGDAAIHVPWEQLALFLSSSDPVDAEIKAGLDLVVGVCGDARRAKYLRTDDRETVARLANTVLELLRARTNVPLSRWSGRDFEEVLTGKTNVTVWLDLVFKVQGEQELELWDGDDLSLMIRAQFMLAGHVGKGTELGRWWSSEIATAGIDVPGVGRFESKPNRWLVYVERVRGSFDDVAHRASELGALLLKALEQRLARANHSLRR
jgi:hypothetical protein